VTCQTHTASGEAIEVGGADFLLPEAAQFPIPEIIGEDKHNTGARRNFCTTEEFSSYQLACEPAADDQHFSTRHLCTLEILAAWG
jgi:hypothetical protein